MVCFFFHNRVICKTVVSALSIVGWVEDYKLAKRLVLAVRTMCVDPPHDMCLPLFVIMKVYCVLFTIEGMRVCVDKANR